MNQKKGIQLSQAFGAVLALILVAVLVIIAIIIFVNLSTSFSGTTSGVSVINESLTPTDAGVAVSTATLCGFQDFSVSNVFNDSQGLIINSANYSVDASAGTITNLTSEFTDSAWNVTYTYAWGSTACTASDNMITEFANYTSLIGLVGTIIFLGLVIGVLVASFVFSNKGV